MGTHMQCHAAEIAAKNAEIAQLKAQLAAATGGTKLDTPTRPSPQGTYPSAVSVPVTAAKSSASTSAECSPDEWVVERLAARRTVRRFTDAPVRQEDIRRCVAAGQVGETVFFCPPAPADCLA